MKSSIGSKSFQYKKSVKSTILEQFESSWKNSLIGDKLWENYRSKRSFRKLKSQPECSEIRAKTIL